MRPDLIEHLPRLRRYARALTGDAGQADDLVQDTLERALLKLDLWQPGSNLRAWLFTLMHNLFVNHVRARRPAETAIDDAMDLPVSGGQMEALAVRDIHAALASLPEVRAAVKRWLEEGEKRTIELVLHHQAQIERVALVLAEKETLTQEELDALLA